MLMLAVDTGAAMTMIGEEAYKRYFPLTEHGKSKDMFWTAYGKVMVATGQFRVSVQQDPVTIDGMKITVANVVGDGLLVLDYLSAADVWVSTKEGELHMRVGKHTMICHLRS